MDLVKDKAWLAGFTVAASINAIAATFASNPIPFGIVAVTFALLAIAWAPRS